VQYSLHYGANNHAAEISYIVYIALRECTVCMQVNYNVTYIQFFMYYWKIK